MIIKICGYIVYALQDVQSMYVTTHMGLTIQFILESMGRVCVIWYKKSSTMHNIAVANRSVPVSSCYSFVFNIAKLFAILPFLMYYAFYFWISGEYW